MNFNSIKVQLEQHNGKRRDTRDRYFNSIKVQLELSDSLSPELRQQYFNSIKVQLEPYEYKKVDKYFLTISIP